MQLVFDLDGTVVDNRAATRRAYEEAGVTSFPPDWYYVSGWATREQRERKNILYPHHLSGSPILSAGLILLQTGGLVLSGCSPASLETFLRLYPHFGQYDITYSVGLTQEEKLSRLRLIGGGIYFDDHKDTIDKVRRMPGWKAIDASLL